MVTSPLLYYSAFQCLGIPCWLETLNSPSRGINPAGKPAYITSITMFSLRPPDVKSAMMVSQRD